MENLIRFETFQYISFILASSLFMYLTLGMLEWFIKRLKVKRPRSMPVIIQNR